MSVVFEYLGEDVIFPVVESGDIARSVLMDEEPNVPLRLPPKKRKRVPRWVLFYLIGVLAHVCYALLYVNFVSAPGHREVRGVPALDRPLMIGLEVSVWAPLWPLMVAAEFTPIIRPLVPFGEYWGW